MSVSQDVDMAIGDGASELSNFFDQAVCLRNRNADWGLFLGKATV
jgi:hypothetical protein